VVSPEIEHRDEVEVGNRAKHKMNSSGSQKKKSDMNSFIFFTSTVSIEIQKGAKINVVLSHLLYLHLLLLIHLLFKTVPSDNRFATDTVKILGRQVFPCLAPNNPQVLIS
jgi:hypothetical protein